MTLSINLAITLQWGPWNIYLQNISLQHTHTHTKKIDILLLADNFGNLKTDKDFRFNGVDHYV